MGALQIANETFDPEDRIAMQDQSKGVSTSDEDTAGEFHQWEGLPDLFNKLGAFGEHIGEMFQRYRMRIRQQNKLDKSERDIRNGNEQ